MFVLIESKSICTDVLYTVNCDEVGIINCFDSEQNSTDAILYCVSDFVLIQSNSHLTLSELWTRPQA